MGRCKACKRGARAELTETVHRAVQTYTSVQGARLERSVYSYSYDGGRPSKDRTKVVRGACTCGAQVSLKRVMGVVNDHVCDARCMGATGPSCECSCGGKNHGSGHGGLQGVR